MATSTNSKVFVSPGVYTSEVDLSFVAQSVGVTTLGIVGETLKGPAFEPIFITNYDEFSTYFGGTSPEKFINTQIPKYEASYIAKSYLQQSNQLFVTRVLGLSGYDAGPSWSIVTKANVNPATIGLTCVSSTTVDCITECVEYLSVPFTFDFSGCTSGSESITLLDSTQLPEYILEKINLPYEQFNGGVSSLSANVQTQLFSIINTPSLSATSINYYGAIPGVDYSGLTSYTSKTNVYGVSNLNSDLIDYSNSLNDPWYYSLFDNIGGGAYTGSSFYNVVTNIEQTSALSNCASFYSLSVSGTPGNINYNNNTIYVYLPDGTDLTNVIVDFSACTTDITVDSVTQVSGVTVNDFTGGCLTYTLVSQDSSVTTDWTICVTTDNPCNPATTGNTGSFNGGVINTCYSGTVTGILYVFTGESYHDYDDLVVTTLRSRGIANYSNDNGAVYEVPELTGVTLNMSGLYSGVTKNPFSTFAINVTNKDGELYIFDVSLSNSDSKYISKVLGSSNFSKDRTTVPLFVEERYQNLLTYGWRKGYVRGLSTQLTSLPDARQGFDPTSIGYYLEKYQSPSSSWVVSELRGNKVYNLFKFTTISDGDSANTEVKVSIANISFNNGTFDVIVRDFFDSDSAPVVIEKFTNCSMDFNQNNYIAKKIGTIDGEYELKSKFIMVEVNENAPSDALPCGFRGYDVRTYTGVKSPFPIFKTKYDYPGEVVYNPPFGLASGVDDAIRSAGDNVRRTYLGFSDTIGYDVDFTSYKGKQLPLDLCTATSASIWDTKTKGFHMDNRASGITIQNTFYEKVYNVDESRYVLTAVTSATTEFYVGDANFSSDPDNESNPYYRLYARKFTLVVAGGFDGWDIYRESRTNTDRYVLGRPGYLRGACPSVKYPTANGWGAFKQITVGDNTQDWANTDYYAYLLGQKSFANPEAVNINVFTTPGIDYVNHSDLVESAIDMVENDRADSIYICTTPDYNMFVPSVGEQSDFIYPQEAVDNLDTTGIDSNYTATYYPWVLTRDSVNNTQIYLPPTAEVTRNLALTDNIAFPWFAAAGYTRGIVNAVKARKKLTQEDRDVLYKGRINPIATFSDVGTVIWGNKTLQIRESALDRINVRRLLLQARKLISAVSVRLLFEQNDQKVRQDFLDSVNPILDSIRRDRGLYDFRVTVSSDEADLDRNQMTGKIFIKPAKALEFIDITFYITPTGASFENI